MKPARQHERQRTAVLPALATLVWIGAGLAAGRILITPPAPVTATLAPASVTADSQGPAQTVAALGLAEQAAAAMVRGGPLGQAELDRLPQRADAALVAGLTDHYVERLTVVDLSLTATDGVVVVRADALLITPAGYEPADPVLVSVPVTAHDQGWALSGQPFTRLVGTPPSGTDG